MPASTAGLTHAERRELAHAADTCPVRLSILEAIDVPVELEWPH
jgi:hypothetical protein